MMRKHFKNLLYSIIFIGVSSFAGSFEDFFIAIRNDHTGKVGALLQRGFDPNARSEEGQLGLVLAMQEGSLKTADVLLSHPAIQIDALNQAGESALMMAALKGEMAGLRTLLARGAKVNQPGWSALHYAASGTDASEAVRLLLEKGADVNAVSPNGSTPLMMAAQYGSEDSVKLLLAGGADPKRRNQRDLKASDFARLAGRDKLATALARLEG